MAEEKPTEPTQLQLPEFEGETPTGVVLKLSGSTRGIQSPLRVGQKVALLVDAVVADVNHKTSKTGLERVEVVKALDIYEIPASASRALLQQTREQVHGIVELFSEPEAVQVQFVNGDTAIYPDDWRDEDGEFSPAPGELFYAGEEVTDPSGFKNTIDKIVDITTGEVIEDEK